MIYTAVDCYANVMHFGRITLFLRNCWNGDLGGFLGLRGLLMQLQILVLPAWFK